MELFEIKCFMKILKIYDLMSKHETSSIKDMKLVIPLIQMEFSN